ncbi:MAG: RidA family protein [Vicinamibacterales bacterium]
MKPEAISAPDAPGAIGPYSPAIRAGNLLFLSGQIPIDPRTGQLVDGDVAVQTEQVMRNIAALLAAAGASFAHVVRTTVFLADMDEFAAMNAVYGKFVADPPPARATVQVARLPRDVRIEIDAIAVLPEVKGQRSKVKGQRSKVPLTSHF